MPPNPTTAGAGVGGVDGKLKLTGAGAGIAGAGDKLGVDTLFAEPAIFSCVLPKAAIPRTAPIARWNNPAPCRVNGFHCVIG